MVANRADAPAASAYAGAQGWQATTVAWDGELKPKKDDKTTLAKSDASTLAGLGSMLGSLGSKASSALGTASKVAPKSEQEQAAEEIALGDAKVIEADSRVAAVQQEDAASQRQLESVILAQHELLAPFDARVIGRHKELGSIVNPGEPMFTLIAPDSIWVKAHIDEALAGGLNVGQRAFVRLRSESDRVYQAELVRIDQENDRVTEERRVYVRCRACGPQHQLRFLGEQAEIEIVKKILPSGLFVPLRAVEAYDGRSGTVWVVQDGRLAKRRVQLGERLIDGRVQVTSDPAGAVVVDERTDPREGRSARASGQGP
jgi:HlyD family secretion protein